MLGRRLSIRTQARRYREIGLLRLIAQALQSLSGAGLHFGAVAVRAEQSSRLLARFALVPDGHGMRRRFGLGCARRRIRVRLCDHGSRRFGLGFGKFFDPHRVGSVAGSPPLVGNDLGPQHGLRRPLADTILRHGRSRDGHGEYLAGLQTFGGVGLARLTADVLGCPRVRICRTGRICVGGCDIVRRPTFHARARRATKANQKHCAHRHTIEKVHRLPSGTVEAMLAVDA